MTATDHFGRHLCFSPDGLDVSVGDAVRVRGNVSEFNGLTEITASKIWLCPNGASVSPIDISLPVATLDAFEAYEGMLVRFPQPLVISEYFNYDRFGEMVLALPLDGESRPFTGTAIDEPGAPAWHAPWRTTSGASPSTMGRPPRTRLSYAIQTESLSACLIASEVVTPYRTQSAYWATISACTASSPPGRPITRRSTPRPAAPEPIGGSLRVAAMNTLNFFLTLDYPTGNPLDNKCGPLQNVECRGADSDQPDEFTRQRTKLLEALAAWMRTSSA